MRKKRRLSNVLVLTSFLKGQPGIDSRVGEGFVQFKFKMVMTRPPIGPKPVRRTNILNTRESSFIRLS